MKSRGKQFLSDSYEENGRVSWEVRTEPNYEYEGLVEAHIDISDCSKTITLDLTCEKNSHIDKRINKVERLINELECVKLALLDAKNELTNKKFYY